MSDLNEIKAWFEKKGFDPAGIAAWEIILGKEWHEAQYQHDQLEAARKPLRGQLIAEFMSQEKTAYNLAQAKAESDDRYRELLDSIAFATKEAGIARVKYNAFIAYKELKRTEEATKRQEMRSFPQ